VLRSLVDLLEPEGQIELVRVGTVGSQTNALKARARMLENGGDQSSSDTTPSIGWGNIEMTEPGDGVVGKGVSIEPAHASKVAVQTSHEKCLSRKEEAIGPAPPIIGKALHAPEALGQALGNKLLEIERQFVDTLDMQGRLHRSL